MLTFFTEQAFTQWHDKFEGRMSAPHGDTTDLYACLLPPPAAFLTSIPPPDSGHHRRVDLELTSMEHFLVYDGKEPRDASSGTELGDQSEKGEPS